MVIDAKKVRTGVNGGGNKGGRVRAKDGKRGRGIMIGRTSGNNNESASGDDG